MVVTMDIQSFLLISLLGLLDFQPGLSMALMKDETFETEFIMHNKTVRCSGKTSGTTFNAPMYTCHNISVDGANLFYGYNDFVEELDRDPTRDYNNNGCPDCACGSYDTEPNDVLELCAAMLAVTNKKAQLATAYVKDPICTQKKAEERVKFFLIDGKPRWLTVHTNNGYIKTLQCLTTKQ